MIAMVETEYRDMAEESLDELKEDMPSDREIELKKTRVKTEDDN